MEGGAVRLRALNILRVYPIRNNTRNYDLFLFAIIKFEAILQQLYLLKKKLYILPHTTFYLFIFIFLRSKVLHVEEKYIYYTVVIKRTVDR